MVKKSRTLEEDCSFETSYDLMNQRIKVKLLEMMYPVAVVKIFLSFIFLNKSKFNFELYIQKIDRFRCR